MEQRLRLAELEVQRTRYQSDSMRSSSVTGSGMASPDLIPHEHIGGYSHDNQPHDLQYADNMMMFSQMPSGQQPFDQQTLAMMGMPGSSHTPTSMAMNQPQQQQQKQRMGMIGINQFQQSPIVGGGGEGMSGVHMNHNFGQEQYHDPGLDELLASTMHSHPGQ